MVVSVASVTPEVTGCKGHLLCHGQLWVALGLGPLTAAFQELWEPGLK